MSGKTVLFIESNTTGTGGRLLELALKQGYRTHFICADPSRYPFLAELWLPPIVADTSSVAALRETVVGLRPDAILSTSEYYLETAARLAAELGLHGADPEAIALCRDKGRLAECLKRAGVPAPETVILTRPEDLAEVGKRLTFPVVVKPAMGSGSIGVRLCKDLDSLRASVAALFGKKENERGLAASPNVLVQEYLDGPEFSVEVIGTGRGLEVLAITRKHLGSPPHFVETGHDLPAALPAEQSVALDQATREGLKATGLIWGPAHLEFRFYRDRPVLIEINPRLAGGMIPALIEQALGIDPLARLLDLTLNGSADLSPVRLEGSSIRFFVAELQGRLRSVPDRASLSALAGVVDLAITRTAGEAIHPTGDFRDRIGWVITRGKDIDESALRADAVLAKAEWQIGPLTEADGAQGFNERHKPGLHEAALPIVRSLPSPAARSAELQQLVALDRAHLLMLLERGLISKSAGRTLLRAMETLEQEAFDALIDRQAPRGTYLLYEDALIERCGLEVGGAVHLGRSRNDMNAAQFKLALRAPFRETQAALFALRQSLLAAAERHQEAAMPVYSQYQPGLPGTYGFYLAGVEEALSRDQQGLMVLLDDLDRSPLGAGAGAGTTVPINPELTAELLGFRTTAAHALDAVASRDLGLRLLAALAATGVTLSRCLQDLQLWTTREFDYLRTPDNLTGGSSMMPQKRNPYLLEMAQGRAAVPAAAFSEALQGMLKTPFSNSVQVGTEAVKPIDRAFGALREAALLVRLHIDGATPNRQTMRAGLLRGAVMTTAMAESLALSGRLSFRDAHQRLGQSLVALDQQVPVDQALRAAFPEAADACPQDPLRWPALFAHGGGPGALSRLLDLARTRLASDGTLLREACWHWRRAHETLKRAVAARLANDHPSEEENPS